MKLFLAFWLLTSTVSGQAPPASYHIHEFKNNLGAAQFQFGSTGELVSTGPVLSSGGLSKLIDLTLTGSLDGKDATFTTLGVSSADVTGVVTAKSLDIKTQVAAATLVADSVKAAMTVTSDKIVAGE